MVSYLVLAILLGVGFVLFAVNTSNYGSNYNVSTIFGQDILKPKPPGTRYAALVT